MKRYFAILCSSLILISGMGVTISQHYCNDVFQKQSILGIPVERGADTHSCNEHKSKCGDNQQSNVPCCENDRQLVEADIDWFKSNTENSQVIPIVIMLQSNEIIVNAEPVEHIQPYHSPLHIELDRQVLFQSFLC